MIDDEIKLRILITGGAGFIGTNLANRLLSNGHEVIIFDNLSRPGSKNNLAWLEQNHKKNLNIHIADIRDIDAVNDALDGVHYVFHFAAQVAVTRSLEFPLEDFDINVRGTLNLLECLRKRKNRPGLLFTSTNKVYGKLSDIPLSKCLTRYQSDNQHIHLNGISEKSPLDFYSPYGCSKGAADQYVLDYSRNYSIEAVVFRMSCIYGPHQFGNEDQGWIAHFLIRAIENVPITIYGDGLQVRDILYIDDLLDAMHLAQKMTSAISGQAFSIGGGPLNTLSLIELINRIKMLHGKIPPLQFAPWRAGDQKYYVSDISAFSNITNWKPATDTLCGIENIYKWLKNTKCNQSEESKTQAYVKHN